MGYEPIRYFMLTAGYRMPLNYTVELIESCKNSLERLYTCRENLDFALSKAEFGTDETLTAKAEEARKKFCTAMDDDLNTPDALAAMFDLVKEINTLSAVSTKQALTAAAAAFDEIAGVLGLLYNRKKDEIPAEVTALVEKRAAAKKAKDWPAADAIRAELAAMGWAVAGMPGSPAVEAVSNFGDTARFLGNSGIKNFSHGLCIHTGHVFVWGTNPLSRAAATSSGRGKSFHSGGGLGRTGRRTPSVTACSAVPAPRRSSPWQTESFVLIRQRQEEACR